MENLGRYIDPFTDFGFKRLFGSEPHKELLVDFLNELLKGKKQISELRYAQNEHVGQTGEDRKAVFDLYCISDQGERFIVELQKVKQRYFKDRSLFYSSFLIQEQGQRGDGWDYRLSEVYTIGIMDFAFDDSHPDQFLHEVKLMETTRKEVFYDKLSFVYLEIVKFNKAEEELVTHFDKWLFILKNLYHLQDIPQSLQGDIFHRLFEIAEVSKLNKKDMDRYQASLKYKRDWQNTLDYAIEEATEKAVKAARQEAMQEGVREGMEKGIEEGMKKGMEKGMEKGIVKIAEGMKKKGYSTSEIATLTGLSVEKIERL